MIDSESGSSTERETLPVLRTRFALPTPLLLLIDVSKSYHRVFSSWAQHEGIDIVICDRDAVSAYSRHAVLCVYQFHSRRELLEGTPKLVGETRATPLVVLAPKFTIVEAARMIAAGVHDLIRVPAAPDDVLARAAARAKRIERRQIDLDLIGRSAKMQRLRRELLAVSPLDSTVLFTGETGTGKGLAARVLHRYSTRGDLPFVHADCSGLSESLIESELFGHERGAFTGAVTSRAGRFEAVGRGTLFLDEVGELGIGLQAKLLRALEDRVFERVGSNRPRGLSARIVAATNRDLCEDIASGRFRRDLYYRLNIVRIDMPPLRDRKEDIPDLVQILLPRIAARLGVVAPLMPAEFQRFLLDYDWPGNIRELNNFLERMTVQSHSGLLDTSLLERLGHEQLRLPRSSITVQSKLPWRNRQEDEQRMLSAQLQAAGGNISLAARNLGVARSTLRYRLKIHNFSHSSTAD